MYSSNSAQKEDISETEQSMSKGINIYESPPQSYDSKSPSVKMSYGIYLGGDIFTGGGEPVGVNNTWLANCDDVEESNVKK